jgi:pimeloyl-ACP methyl ester carboxylesterase
VRWLRGRPETAPLPVGLFGASTGAAAALVAAARLPDLVRAVVSRGGRPELAGDWLAECPEVEWTANYAVLGPYDYLDVFTAPDVETASKVATMVRVFGQAHTETWAAVEWSRYKELVRQIPDGSIVAAEIA